MIRALKCLSYKLHPILYVFCNPQDTEDCYHPSITSNNCSTSVIFFISQRSSVLVFRRGKNLNILLIRPQYNEPTEFPQNWREFFTNSNYNRQTPIATLETYNTNHLCRNNIFVMIWSIWLLWIRFLIFGISSKTV